MATRGLLLCLFLLILSACSSQEQADYEAAQKEISLSHFRIGLGHLDQVIKRNKTPATVLAALREAARISFFELNDYPRSIQYHRQLILKSPNQNERISSQRQVAQIYFDNLQDYNNAVTEFSKLLLMNPSTKDAFEFRINIARSWFYLNNMFQAMAEVDTLLKEPLDPDSKFEIELLKGNILVAQKKYKEAADQFIALIQSNPDKSTKENVIITLAVCHEENLDFKAAIQVLEKYKSVHPQPDYIELRIRRLKERLKNAPGARGMRK